MYGLFGIPFRLEFLIIGVAATMTVRFTSSFIMAWLRATLQKRYEETLRTDAFGAALDAEVRYFD
jgi:subfamily B ATP-binding cassette protein MsbA